MNRPPRQSPSTVLEALGRRRLLIVSGKGGVGRTTVSALLGAGLARRGKRVLVATTGHDDRLAWLFGAESLPDEPLEVGSGLSVQRLVPRVCVREYGALVLRSERLSSAVFDNRVVRRMLGAIPGLDDFAVLGKVWHEATRGDRFDVVVFDGPATGHLRLTLGLPKAILETVPGGPLVGEAELMQAGFEDGEQVAAVLVGLPETWPLTELGELGAVLREEIGLSIGSFVINGTVCADLPELGPITGVSDALATVITTVDAVTRRGRTQADEVDGWLDSEAARRCAAESVLEVGWQFGGLDGRDAFEALLHRLEAG